MSRTVISHRPSVPSEGGRSCLIETKFLQIKQLDATAANSQAFNAKISLAASLGSSSKGVKAQNPVIGKNSKISDNEANSPYSSRVLASMDNSASCSLVVGTANNPGGRANAYSVANIISQPSAQTKWQRGSPAVVEWQLDDASVQDVRIELLRKGSRATTIVAKSTSNCGRFLYSRVPWGMLIGDGYYIRISAVDDSSLYKDSDIFCISR